MDKIKWGILGPGIIAQQFASDFKNVKNAELIAVASRSAERAKLFADEYGIPLVYDSYSKLLENSEIDIVYIATPHNFHFEMCKTALLAGKAVLCEKPITISAAELKELIKIAKENNVFLAEGLWTYFLPAIKKAYTWFADGRIGKLKHVKSDFGYPMEYKPEHRMFNPDLAGGTIFDIGVYNLAMTKLFINSKPKTIQVLARKAPTGVESDVQLLFDYGAVTASLHNSFECKLNNYTYVIGDEGYIAIHDFWRSKECYLYEGEKVVDSFIDENEGFGFNYEIESVSNDLLDGKKESKVSSHDSSIFLQEIMEVVLAKIDCNE